MRADRLMINADPETLSAFHRAIAFKVAAALTLVLFFTVIALTAPDSSDSATSMAPTTVQQAPTPGSNLGSGSDIDTNVTSGVDMHG